jgi:hypothetical protein
MKVKSRLMLIAMFVSSLFTANVFADDTTASAGAQAGAGASAISQSGGGGGGQGGQGGLGVATAGVNQLNALSNQAGATGNTTNTSLTLGGTTIPANTTANNTIHTTTDGTQTIKNVPSMGAPGLTTTLTETCMGSSSGGGAVAGFGLTFGSTWKDIECVNRLNSREVKSLPVPGAAMAAKEILCANAEVRASFKNVGEPCFIDRPSQNRSNTAAVQSDSDMNIASNVQAKEEKKSWFSSSQPKTPSTRRNEFVPHQWWQD